MAVVFNGSSQYGRFPNTTDTGSLFNTSKNCSLAVWFKPNGGTGKQWLAGTDSGTLGSGVTRYMGFTFRQDDSDYVSYSRASAETHTRLAIANRNVWNVAVISRPLGGNITAPAALNATDVNLTGLYGSSDYEARGFSIGARADSTAGSPVQWFFNGAIGGFAVWQRLLTTEEINSLQAGAHPNTISGAEYLFPTGSGTATTLTSSSGRVMTFTGSPTLNNESPFAPPSVDSVNGGTDTVRIGQSFTYTTTNLTPTSGTLDGSTLTSVTSSGATINGLVDGGTIPRAGSARTLAMTGTSGTGDRNITVLAPFTSDLEETMTYTTLAAGFSTAPATSVVADFSPAASVGDQIFGDPRTITLFPNAGFQSDFTGTQTLWHLQASTGIVRSYLLITGTGESDDSELSMNGLTMQSLTMQGMTAT